MTRKETVKAVWDRKHLAAKRGHGAIEFAIYLAPGQRKYLSFGKATELEWKRMASSSVISEQKQKYQKLIEAMKMLGEEMTISNFMAHLEVDALFREAKKESGKVYNGFDLTDSFIDYIREAIEEESIKENTRTRKYFMVHTLEEFGRIKTFEDITAANILAYDRFLHKGNRTDATVFSYHKRLKFYINLARCEGRIASNPYELTKFKRGCYKERKPLTEEELILLRDAPLKQEKLIRVRDLFIFMAYTGLAYCDAQSFNFKKMSEKLGDMFYIDGKRTKTATNFFTPILNPAMAVLEKYDFNLPKISNQKMNDFLHIIEERLGFNKPLTCHVARHSFATLCLNHGVPIETVAKMLGHTNIKTTQIYAKVMRSTIERQAQGLANSIH